MDKRLLSASLMHRCLSQVQFDLFESVIFCAYFHSVPFERLQEIGIFPVRATEFTVLRSDSAPASLAGLRNPVTGQSTIAR